MVELYAEQMPTDFEKDLETIAQPIDVVGVNYYERCIVKDAPGAGILRRELMDRPGSFTADREIYPAGISEVLSRLHLEYRVPRIVVTENGAVTPGIEAPLDGQIDDKMRVEFLNSHLREVAASRSRGVPVDAYFAWSLLDNFEWSEGYTLGYGMVHVDFETQKRTPKASAHYYRELCGSGTGAPGEAQ